MEERDLAGKFIVIEGADGAGTTTMSKKLAEELEAHWTREPTGDKIGEKVDEMISGNKHSPNTVSLGFAADRLVHLEEEIIPRLKRGETVVCDRYYHSSLVYQPISGSEYEWVKELNRYALKPDMTILLDIKAETGMSRVKDRGKDGNKFEELDFQQKVVVKYRKLEEKLDEEIENVDASKSKEEVFKSIQNVLDS